MFDADTRLVAGFLADYYRRSRSGFCVMRGTDMIWYDACVVCRLHSSSSLYYLRPKRSPVDEDDNRPLRSEMWSPDRRDKGAIVP